MGEAGHSNRRSRLIVIIIIIKNRAPPDAAAHIKALTAVFVMSGGEFTESVPPQIPYWFVLSYGEGEMADIVPGNKMRTVVLPFLQLSRRSMVRRRLVDSYMRAGSVIDTPKLDLVKVATLTWKSGDLSERVGVIINKC